MEGKLGLGSELVDKVEGDCIEEVSEHDGLVLLSSIQTQVVEVFGVVSLPGELQGRVVPGASDGVKGIDESKTPLLLSVYCLLVDGESVLGLVESKSPVEKEIFVLSLDSDLVDEVADGTFALQASVEVELDIVLGEDTVIVVQLEAIVFDAGIEGSVLSEGEPDLKLVSSVDASFLLSEGLLEGDSGGGGLACGLEGEELVVDEIVVKDGPFAFLQGGPGFGLERVRLRHQQNPIK